MSINFNNSNQNIVANNTALPLTFKASGGIRYPIVPHEQIALDELSTGIVSKSSLAPVVFSSSSGSVNVDFSNKLHSVINSKMTSLITNNDYEPIKDHIAYQILLKRNFIEYRIEKLESSLTVPYGTICMVYDEQAQLPPGWAFCNGQTVNGHETPDMRTRFAQGSYPYSGGGNYLGGNPTKRSGFRVGEYGGWPNHILKDDEIPVHNHVLPFGEKYNVPTHCPYGVSPTHGRRNVGSGKTDGNNSWAYTSGPIGLGPTDIGETDAVIPTRADVHYNLPEYVKLPYIMFVGE